MYDDSEVRLQFVLFQTSFDYIGFLHFASAGGGGGVRNSQLEIIDVRIDADCCPPRHGDSARTRVRIRAAND